MCNACGFHCCADDSFEGCGCDHCWCEACHSEDWRDGDDDGPDYWPEDDDRPGEDDSLEVEVLEPETPAGVKMFHVERWPGLPDLWLYRTDAGELRSALAVRGLTPSRLAPVARAIEDALREAA